jgi:hypothetical protein
MTENRFNFGAGQDHRHIPVALGANDAIELAEFPAQHVAIKEELMPSSA